MVSCSGFGLPLHAQLLRLFVTTGVYCFVCFRRPRARWVLLVVAGCLGPCSCTPFLVLLVRARGLSLRLGVCLLGALPPIVGVSVRGCGGLLPCAACCVVGLRWLADVSCACVPLLVTCSGFGLPVHAQLLRLFVITRA